jgi:hypothetical protein
MRLKIEMLNHWKSMLQKLRMMRRLMHLSLLTMTLRKLLYLQLKMLRMKLRLLLFVLLLRRLEPQYLLLFVVLLCLLDMLMYYMQHRWFEARLVIDLFELQVV